MSEQSYRGGGTPGGKWGCALAALVGLPLFGLVMVIAAIGDCTPGDACNHSLDWLLFLAAVAISAIVGLGSKLLINALIDRAREDR